MKKVQSSNSDVIYKCDYCSLINPNHDVIVEHERDCAQNPINRNCPTCQVYSSWLLCNFSIGVSGMGCRKWKNLRFERTSKLTLLKNIIKDKII